MIQQTNKRSFFSQLTPLLLFLLLLIGASSFAQTSEEKEWELEKLIEARIKKSLSTLLRPDEFYIYVDLKPVAGDGKELPSRRRESMYGEDSSLEGLDKNLPGLPRTQGPGELVQDPYSLSYGEMADQTAPTSSTEESYTRDVTLILNNEIDSEKINLITGLVSKTAQIDKRRGDKLALKLVDYQLEPVARETAQAASQKAESGEATAAAPGSAPPVKELEGTGLLPKFGGLAMGIAAFLLLLFVLLLVLLLRRRSPSLKEAQIIRDQQQLYDPMRQNQMGGTPAAPPVSPTAAPSIVPPRETAKAKGDEDAAKQLNKEILKQEIINGAYGRPEAVAQILRTWMNEENGLRNSAAIIRSMGLETASSLMKAVPSDVRTKVFSYYGNASDWKVDEEVLALEKFNNGLMAQKIQAMMGPEAGDEEYFGFLKKMNDYQIYLMVKDEEPPVIALLLAHMPADRASKLLAQFEEKKKTRLAVELGNLNSVDVNILNAITKRLAERSLHIPKLNFTPGMGVNSLVACIDNLDLVSEKKLLEAVKERDTELSERIRKTYFFFDDLPSLTSDALKTVLREVPKNILTASLAGADERILNTIMKFLPERKAEMIAFEMEKLKGLSASERIKAQKEFVRVVREMIKKGELDLEKAFKQPEPAQAAQSVNLEGASKRSPEGEMAPLRPSAPPPPSTPGAQVRRPSPSGPPPVSGVNPRTTMPPITGVRPKPTEMPGKVPPKSVNPGPTNEN